MATIMIYLLPLVTLAAGNPVYLTGRLDAAALADRVARYGPDLGPPLHLDVGESHTCAVAGDRLVVGGRNRIHVFDISDPAQPRQLGVSPVFGHVRHLVVRGELVYVASRADGLFILDISDPSAPRVVGSYDPVEFATALAVSGDVLMIACRHFGVELVDIREPLRPKHLAVARTGEAQGLAVRNGIAYVGVWGSRELVVVDCRRPRQPEITAKLPLDGYGNGVGLADGRVLVACGHHARGMTQNDPADPMYGHGHGLELFRLDDPPQPTPEAKLKSMPNYRLGPDAWVVQAAGDQAFVGDGLGGLYRVALDGEPRHTGQALLPFIESKQQYDYAHDVAISPGMVWVSGAFGGIYGFAMPGLAAPEDLTGEPLRVDDDNLPPPPPDGWRCWRLDEPIHKLAVDGDVALAAAGRAGLYLLRLWPEFEVLDHRPTDGVAFDVRLAGELAVSAEGPAGLRTWRRVGDRLEALGSYQAKGPIRGVVLTPTQHALLHVGDANFEILDLRESSRPRLVYACGSEGRGLLYGDQISDDLVAGRYACVAWHVKPPALFDLAVEPPAPAGELPLAIRGQRGIVGVADGALAVAGGGVLSLQVGGTEPAVAKDAAAGWFEGRAVKAGEQLLVWRRHDGRVWLVDVLQPHQPRVVEALSLPGNPGRPQLTDRGLVVPCGHAGLLVRDRR